jgi:hypothetical protein
MPKNLGFVITESLIDKDIILGRDFMKKYNVIINHGTDEIHIDAALDNEKLNDPMCYVTETREILPNTENVVKCHTHLISKDRQVLFTPDNV